MIVVDSSAWIAYLRGRPCRETTLVQHFMVSNDILVGDLVMVEVLQGAKSERESERISRVFERFSTLTMLSPELAIKAAANYRQLRRRGITIRKTIDLIIGTFCIEHGHALLHADRDFLPMVEHLGLQLA